MATAKNFYSSTDAALASGAANLIAIVTPTPGAFGLTTSELTSYQTLTTNFTDLLTLSDNPITRTPVVIGEKQLARRALKSASVNMARTITAVPTVTNPQLVSLRLNERIIPQPRPVPMTPPTIEVLSCAGRVATIRVHDVATESRRKPFGAIGADIYWAVGSTVPTDPSVYRHAGMATRAKMLVSFPDEVASGATVWLCGCWVSARGQRSLGSTPVSFTLQGGPVSGAEAA